MGLERGGNATARRAGSPAAPSAVNSQQGSRAGLAGVKPTVEVRVPEWLTQSPCTGTPMTPAMRICAFMCCAQRLDLGGWNTGVKHAGRTA